MTEESPIDKKPCGSKKGVMLAYGFIQLGTSVISCLSLAAIAISFCSVRHESRLLTDCVEEVRSSGRSTSAALRYCNGGK